jgi:hypothetical protein
MRVAMSHDGRGRPNQPRRAAAGAVFDHGLVQELLPAERGVARKDAAVAQQVPRRGGIAELQQPSAANP